MYVYTIEREREGDGCEQIEQAAIENNLVHKVGHRSTFCQKPGPRSGVNLKKNWGQ